MEPDIPDPTLPRYPYIQVRPFDIEADPRELTSDGSQSLLPLLPVLRNNGTAGSPSWVITVTDGYVLERVPKATGDTIVNWFPENIMDGADRAEFAIAVGDQVSVLVEHDETGAIAPAGADDAVRIVIEAEDTSSTHYKPIAADDTTGAVGVYHYKLAVLRDGVNPGDPPFLEHYLSRSHIDHFRDIPQMDNVSGSGSRVLKEFDQATNRHLLRRIHERASDPQVNVSEDGDMIVVEGNSKNLIITYTIGEGSPVTVAEFADGLETTGTDAETVPTINIPIPLAVTTGYTGTISIADGCGTGVHIMTFADGVLTDYEFV